MTTTKIPPPRKLTESEDIDSFDDWWFQAVCYYGRVYRSWDQDTPEREVGVAINLDIDYALKRNNNEVHEKDNNDKLTLLVTVEFSPRL